MASIMEASFGELETQDAIQTRVTGGLNYIDFGSGGDARAYLGGGWSAQEPRGVWTIGPTSELRLPAVWVARDHVLRILLEPYLSAPWCRGQFLRLIVNGHPVGEAFVRARRHLTARIAAEYLTVGEPVVVTMEHPGFAIPSALNGSRDQRPLGVHVLGVWLWTEGLIRGAPSRPDLVSDEPVAILSKPAPARKLKGREAGALSYSFGVAGSIKPYLTKGWHSGEAGFTWTIAREASISLPSPAVAGPVVMKLTVHAPSVGDVATPQRLAVSCGGEILGQFVIAGLHVYETVLMPVPDRLIESSSTLDLEFRLPDAMRPSDNGKLRDDRLLGLCFQRLELDTAPEHGRDTIITRYPARPHASPPRRISAEFLDTPNEDLIETLSAALAMPLDDMLKRSESLGENCEFGIIQRKLGAEVLGLLRFANTGLQMLVNALGDEFAAMANPAEFAFHLGDQAPREYGAKIPRYGITWHTFVMQSNGMPPAEQARQIARLSYLRRRFYEGLKTGRKLYVLKDTSDQPIDRFIPVFLALNRPAHNRLLLVVPAPVGVRAGSVEQIAPGLMRGYVSAFAPNDDVTSADPYVWLPMLANAWRLARADGLV